MWWWGYCNFKKQTLVYEHSSFSSYRHLSIEICFSLEKRRNCSWLIVAFCPIWLVSDISVCRIDTDFFKNTILIQLLFFVFKPSNGLEPWSLASILGIGTLARNTLKDFLIRIPTSFVQSLSFWYLSWSVGILATSQTHLEGASKKMVPWANLIRVFEE